MSSDQPTKGRRKGARGRKPKQQSDLQDHDVADEPSTEIAATGVPGSIVRVCN